jgi:hypothetical protein
MRPGLFALPLILALLGLSACAHTGSTQGYGAATPASQTTDGIGAGLRAGAAWYSLERFGAQTFRWAKNDAEIVVCSNAVHETLSLEMEPGPALGSKTMALTAKFANGTEQKFVVADRRPVSIKLPQTQPQTVRLHVTSRNLPTPGEPRTLNFRLFTATAGSPLAGCPSEIAHDGSVAIASGWYPIETYQGETYRWVNNDAHLIPKNANSRPVTLEVEVAPGPGLAGKPLVLQLADAAGHIVGKTPPVYSRMFVAFKLPAGSKSQQFELRTTSQNAAVLGDRRTLNFRVFDIHLSPSN